MEISNLDPGELDAILEIVLDVDSVIELSLIHI